MKSFNILNCLWTACLLLCLLFSSTFVDAKKMQREKYCKLDRLIDCFGQPMAYFTSQQNGSGIPANNSEFEQFCL